MTIVAEDLSEFEVRALDIFDRGFWSGLMPDPLLGISEWADTNRVLSNIASAEPGRFRTSRTPYLREIQECLSPMSHIQEVVFMKGAQIGGTEAGNNWIGYVIDCAPGPFLAVQPTVELAKRNSKTRIRPLIEETPRLKGKVKSTKSRDGGNTILSKEFPGGILVLAGANSAVALRSMPVRYLMLDEVDGYPDDVDGEGDPVGLAEARTRTFQRRKIYKVSTPTFEGRSKIQNAYEESDKRRYFVPCPHCKEKQWLKWSQVKWPDGKPESAFYVCEHCEGVIQEHHKTWMLEHGKWIAENPGAKNGKVAGFHLSALYSPMGWYSWGDAAQKWISAQGRPDKLREFVNTTLGETWREKGEAPEWQRLYDRREDYKVGTVAEPVVFLTAGVDVQKDRLEVEVVGWGRDKQSWSVDYVVIPGDTAEEATWLKLDQVLGRTWQKKCGVDLPIRIMAVDTGYNTQHVYNWVRRHPMSRVMAVKGSDDSTALLSLPGAVDVAQNGKRIRRGLKLWRVGSGIAKGELYGWLKLPSPEEGQPFPPGYCHFPQYHADFFKQMTAEQLTVRIVKGYRKYQWEKIRDRNESLDCRVYARCAASAAGMDRYSEAQWLELAGAAGVAIVVSPAKNSEGQESPKPSQQPATERRRSSFWDKGD